MSKKNILLVESNNDALVLLKEILEDRGYNVLGTVYIENAFDILVKGITIDLIMASTYVESVESVDIVKRFKEHRVGSTIPIVAIVQSRQTNESVQALHKGACDYVAKPIEEDAVDNVLKNVLKESGDEHGKDSSSR